MRTRHTGPNSSDAGTSPTQNVTYSAHGAMLTDGSAGPTSPATTTTAATSSVASRQHRTQRSGVEHRRERGRERAAVARTARPAPQHGEHPERDHQRGSRRGRGQADRHRQVRAGADPVRENPFDHETSSWASCSPRCSSSTSNTPGTSATKRSVVVAPAVTKLLRS